jgi:chloramphenicol 3-O-phosphotransferase
MKVRQEEMPAPDGLVVAVFVSGEDKRRRPENNRKPGRKPGWRSRMGVVLGLSFHCGVAVSR